MGMDEHDKRAREVADDVHLLPGPRRELSKRISALLRSTAAAAERRGRDAERERCAKVCDDEAEEAGRGRPNTVGCARMLAARIRSAPIAAAASPAQADDGMSAVLACEEEYGRPAQAERVSEREAWHALHGPGVDCCVCGAGPYRHNEGCSLARGGLRAVLAASQHRIAARLRARADEAQARAERLDATAETRGTPEHERQSAGRVADLNHALAFALRSEADALEGT